MNKVDYTTHAFKSGNVAKIENLKPNSQYIILLDNLPLSDADGVIQFKQPIPTSRKTFLRGTPHYKTPAAVYTHSATKGSIHTEIAFTDPFGITQKLPVTVGYITSKI